MKELPKDFVAYFGTWGSPGHDLRPLNQNFYDEHGEWAAEFDSDAVMKHLTTDSIRLFFYNGITIVGYPRSLDDHRGGCKTLFIVNGEHDADFMINKMKEYPSVYDKFVKLCATFFFNKSKK